MKTKTFLLSLFLTIASLAQSQNRPNVLMIAIDDLNDWIGCLNAHPQSKTPNLDRLAASGMLFENAHCQSPVCNPSRSSLMTSRYPHNSGLYFLSPNYNQVDDLKGRPTIPETFKKNDYTVMGGGKIFHQQGNNAIFRAVGTYFHTAGFGPLPKKKISPFPGHQLWDWGAFPNVDEKMPDYKLTQWVIKELKKNHNKPFFLAAGFYRPHVPCTVPQKWFDMFPIESIQLPKLKSNDIDDLSKYAISLTRDKHVAPKHEWVVDNNEWKKLIQSYLASITFVDHYVGKILDALEQSNYKDNTYIVLFSDHGFHMGEKARWAKRSLWEDGTRVPMMITGPGILSGRCKKPVELIDIYPTLMELCQLPINQLELDGQSLKPLLDNPKFNWPHMAYSEFGPGNIAIRSERYRYIRYCDGSEEFYDLEKDQHEWNNLASHPEVKSLIRMHRAHLPKSYAKCAPGKSTGHKAFNAASKYIK